MSRPQLLASLPAEIRGTLRRDLKETQLRSALRMHQKRLAIPRHMLNIDPLTEVPKSGCHPALSVALRKKGGRNHHGKITVRHRGGGFKRRIRILDTRRASPSEHTVVRIEHDPNRSSKIALVRDEQSQRLSYVLAWDGIKAGAKFTNDAMQLPGCTMALRDMAVGTTVHNIELRPGRGGQMARSAGCKAVFVGKDPDGKQGSVKLPSGRVVKVPLACRATIGVVSNPEWHLRVIGMAGRMRNLGIRPTVRGVAMNAVDHPHGGGKCGRSKGKPSQSPWGKICK